MLISDDKVTATLKKVAVLREQLGTMCVGKPGYELSVMDLHYVVEQVYDLKITMEEVSFSAVYLRGHVERYSDNSARIRVRSNLSEADKRLVAVKELCHLAIDEEDDWSTDPVAILDAIIEDSRSRAASQAKPNPSPLESEALALVAAIELLYPWEYREADQAKIDAKETTISSIALQHNVPPFVIEEALAKEPLHKKLRSEANGALGIAAE